MPAQLLVPEQPGPDGKFYIVDARTKQQVDPKTFTTHQEAVAYAQQLVQQSYQQQPELGGMAPQGVNPQIPVRPNVGMAGPMP